MGLKIRIMDNVTREVISLLNEVYEHQEEGTKDIDVDLVYNNVGSAIEMLNRQDSAMTEYDRQEGSKDILRTLALFLVAVGDVRELCRQYDRGTIYTILDTMQAMYRKHNISEYRDATAVKVLLQTMVH